MSQSLDRNHGVGRWVARHRASGVPAASSVREPRAIVLLLVVVIVTISAMVGGSAALATATERGATSASRDMAQARAAAWSGIQGVMSELAEQREGLLAGEPPVLTESWTLYADASGRRGVVRLIDLSPEGAGMLIPESSRLDVNSATKTMLVELGLEEGLADRIVAERSQRPFASVHDLLRVPGVTAAMLAGPGESAGGSSDSLDVGSRTGGAAVGSAAGSGPGSGAGPLDLSSLLTVFAFDPNIQAGIGDEAAAEFRGRQRVNLDQAWSERLRDALVERFGQDAATGVENIMKSGVTFASDKDVIATLRRLNLPPESWGGVLDVFTTSDDEYLVGRVDLRTAPEAVLASLPGISPEQAREIVAARERLAADEMASPAWLVTQSLISKDDFENVIDHVTTRCLQWRVRVEAGMTRADSGAAGTSGLGVGGGGAGGDEATVALAPRVVLEAVVDVSSQRVRIAYLRDVSLMETARSILDDPDLADELGLAVPAGRNDGREDFGAGEGGQPTGEEGSGSGPTPGESANPDRGSPAPGTPDNSGDGSEGDRSSSGRASGRSPAGSGFKDRRIGRWTTQGGGS